MTLAPAVQKLLALAILAGLGFALWIGVIMPVKEGYDRDRASAAQSANLIARHRQVLADMPALEADVARLRTHPILKKGVFVAPSSEIAAATLQGMVKAGAAGGGAKLISIQVLPAKDENRFTRIGVRARLSGSVAALRSVLYELQSAWPALVIDSVNIRARTRRQRKEAGAPTELIAMPELAIRFDVYGFMTRKGGQSGDGGEGGDK